jgi:hypothetical protein
MHAGSTRCLGGRFLFCCETWERNGFGVLALLDAPGFWDADSSQEERKISLTPLARTNADAMQCASPCTAAVRQDPSGPSHRIASHRIASHRVCRTGTGRLDPMFGSLLADCDGSDPCTTPHHFFFLTALHCHSAGQPFLLPGLTCHAASAGWRYSLSI